MQRRVWEGGRGSVVKNEGVHEYVEEIVKRSRFLVYLEYNGSGDWSGDMHIATLI